jgi:hypothetical protein
MTLCDKQRQNEAVHVQKTDGVILYHLQKMLYLHKQSTSLYGIPGVRLLKMCSL